MDPQRPGTRRADALPAPPDDLSRQGFAGQGWRLVQGAVRILLDRDTDRTVAAADIVEPEPVRPVDRDEPVEYTGIATDQSGTIGDVTADQMLQHFECSTDEFVRLCRAGQRPPTTLRKALYLEWFSHRNGRVVIQSTRLAVERLGERAFELIDEQWLEQAKQNHEEMGFFMHQIGDALGREATNDADEWDSENDAR